MRSLVLDAYVVVMILSAWVALRFAPLALQRIWRGELARAWLALGMVVFHSGAAYNDLWFYIARLQVQSSLPYHSYHWSVLLARLAMILGCLIWMHTLDGHRGKWYYVLGPVLLALVSAAVLPP